MDMNRNLLDAIRYVESGGDVCAIRDNGRSLGAYLIKRNHYSAAIGANSTLTANGRGKYVAILLINTIAG